MLKKLNKAVIVLIIILGIASFFRLWRLTSIPPGLYPDVAINGNDALDTLKTKHFKVFYPENNGREGLFMWLIVLSFSLFGASIWSIKIVAAIIGILTVFGFYLLTKELFSVDSANKNPELFGFSFNDALASLSSFFLAISFWHTNFSRIGFRVIMVPFILVFAFYFLFKGLRQRKFWNFIVSGIFFGLGFYTYISYRFVVLLVPLILIPFWLMHRKNNLEKKFLSSLFFLMLSVFITALPIGVYFLFNFHDFTGRSGSVSIFSQKNPVKEFFLSLITHLGMFNFQGDRNWRHNYSGAPMLFWPVGILFLIGIAFSIKELIVSLKHKHWSLVVIPWSLLNWFFIMLLPGVLTYEGIPHALRVIGVIPVVYIFAGLGGLKSYQWLYQNTTHKRVLFIAVFLFILMVGIVQFRQYFIDWAGAKETKAAFSTDYLEIGNYLNSLPNEVKKYVIVNQSGVPVPYPSGIPMPAQTPIFIERTKFGEPRSQYLLPENIDAIETDKKTVIIPLLPDGGLFSEFLKRFPNGEISKQNGILIYKINF